MKNNKQTFILAIGIFGAIVAAIGVIYLVRGGSKGVTPIPSSEITSKSSPTAAPIFEIGGSNACELSFNIPCAPGISCVSKEAYQNVSTNTAGSYNLASSNRLASSAVVTGGQIVVYSLSYANTGNTTITTATFTDVLPSNVTYLDGGSACSYQASNRTVSCVVNNVAPQFSGQVAFRVQVIASPVAGEFVNTATLTPASGQGSATVCSVPLTIASSGSPSPSPSPSASVGVSPSPSSGTANLDCLYKRAYEDDSRNRAGFYYLERLVQNTSALTDGQTIIYSIGMKNHGTLPVSDVSLTDVLSSNLTFVDADNGCRYDASSRKVTCDVGTVAGGVETTRSIRVRIGVSGSTSIENTAEVFSTNGQRDTCYLRVDASGKVVVEPSPSPVVTELPVAGVFEVTASTLGVGVLFLLIGALGLFAL